MLVVPEGWSVQYRPEPVGVKETPEIPLATTVTVPVATMGMTGAAWAMISCSCLLIPPVVAHAWSSGPRRHAPRTPPLLQGDGVRAAPSGRCQQTSQLSPLITRMQQRGEHSAVA